MSKSNPTKVKKRAAPRRQRHGGNTTTNINPRSTQPQNAPPQMEKPPLTEVISSNSMRFADLSSQNLVSSVLIDTITNDMGFDHMTPVQEATLFDLLQNRIDCLAQAKTGTGKTIAFLLPAIQTLLNKTRRDVGKISLLVVSPTRELAMQIAQEASALLGRLPQYQVRFAIGGTNKDREEKDILSGCDILIATPGRLYDHLSNAEIVAAFSNLDTLVLDEADRLLDMGFMKALKDIIACLPDKQVTSRQGMLFSATMAPHVQQFAHLVLSPDYKFISTIPAGEINTHEHVIQLLITVPSFDAVLPATVAAIRAEVEHVGISEFKAILFAPTAASADWYAFTLAQVPGFPPISTLHSRISQSKRTNVTNAFSASSSAILVATDVVARGMDFPNVSTIFQVGIPADKESYIHRLGRTARAGRQGRGIFIVTQAEAFFPTYRLKEISFVPTPANISAEDARVVQGAAAKGDIQGKVYQAWLGYYKNHLKALGWTSEQLVAEGNRYAIEALCAGGVPEIQKSTVSKMGLKGVRGLNVVANLPHAGPRGGGEGRRGNAGRGRGGKSGS